jgi:cardiolipin synthase
MAHAGAGVRDSVIVAGAFAYHHLFGEIDIHPTWLGKLHTLMAFSLFIVVMAHQAHLIARADWLMPAFLAVLFSCLASMVQYVVLWARKAAQAAS